MKTLLSPEAVDLIKAKVPPSLTDGSNGFAWKGSSNGEFTVKSAYQALQPIGPSTAMVIANGFWDKIWKWKGSLRISTFMWLISRS